MANNNSLSHHGLLLPVAGDFSDDGGYDIFEPAASSSSAISFPSFWPPFPSLLSDSDSDGAPFHATDRCAPAQRGTAASFLGLDFHDDVWAPPGEDGEVGGLPLCWDCLQLEEHDQRWDLGLSDADEWEQVAGRGEHEDEAAEGAAAVRSLEWEVLLAANSLGSLTIDDDGGGDIDTFLFHDDDEMLFGQLAAEAEHEEPPAKGGRAAAKAAVEGLPTVVVDAAGSGAQCAVCKDGIEAGEGARRLPCAHLYHGGCILPWLAIRNTCPLCRHELPTDDPEYEKWKARRAAGGANGDGDRYGIVSS